MLFGTLVALHASATPGIAFASREPDAVAVWRNIRLSEGVLQTGEQNDLAFTPWKGPYRRLIFEGSIAPAFFLISRRGPFTAMRAADPMRVSVRERTHAPLLVVLVPKVTLRMLAEHSEPVYSPSYMPRLDFYWRLGAGRPFSPAETLGTADYVLVRLSHHSNGQAGDTHLPDGTLNRDFGSWSTNFLEVGYSGQLHPSLGDLARWKRDENRETDEQVSIEVHPPPGKLGREREPTLGYASYHLNFRSDAVLWQSRAPLRIDRNELLASLQLTAMAGAMQRRFSPSRRIAYRTRLLYRPGGPTDLAFFAEFYSGQDYYNISFDQYLKRFSVGLVVWPRTALGALSRSSGLP